MSIDKEFLASLPTLPGVYRMIDAADAVLYVGKAKDLKKRVSSYFQKSDQSPRIRLMLKSVHHIDTTVTRTEAEALLLENNLIKGLKPRFNILFRDDKSYPYLLLTGHRFPRLAYFRGTPNKRDQAFGPYPNSYAVRESIQLLQKVFQLRSCEDTVFANRSRPCLLHQIKRCTAPCVQLITPEAYARDVSEAAQLLHGEASALTEHITAQMNAAADRLDFETAAHLRDRLRMLATVREKQFVDTTGSEADADVVAVAEVAGVIAVNLTMIRGGRHLGDRSFYPQHSEGATPGEALEAFIAQHYLDHPIPARILVSEAIESDALEAVLSEHAHKKVTLQHRVTAQRKVWLTMAQANARLSAERRSSDRANQSQRLAALRETLDLPALNRIECFDISHTMGEATVASCVVYEGDDLKKSDYRRYNISGITPGDDYAAMHAALIKRFHKSVRRKRRAARPAADRRRQGANLDGGRGDDRTRSGRRPAARRRQGRGAQARSGNPDLRRWPRTEAGQGSPRLPPDPAGARRSAPLRHHRPPRQTRQGARAIDAGRHPRHRPQTPQTAARTLRRPAGRARRRRRCACHGQRYQPRIGGNPL